MIVTIIARKEFLNTWRDGQMRLAAGILLTLLLLALAVSVQHWRSQEGARQVAQAEDARIWLAQGAVNPHGAAHFGRNIFKPAGPLAFLDEGVNPYAGSAVYLEAHRQTPTRSRPAENATFLSVFGELTPALTLQVLVPLLIILCAFNGVSGERESGTFRQLLSLGVPRQTLLWGKALGLGGALLLILLPLIPLGAGVILWQANGDGQTYADLVRLVLLSLGYLVFFGTCIGITLAVSALARSSRAALVTLLGCWLLVVLLIPRFAADSAETLAPVATISAFTSAMKVDIKKGLSGHDPQDIRLDPIKQKLFKQYGVKRIEDLPINFDGIDLAEGERYGNLVHDRHFGDLWRQYRHQAVIERWFALASPLLALRPLSMALAGTDIDSQHAFTRQAEDFRRLFIKMMNDYTITHGTYDDWEFTANSELWSRVPPYL